MYMYVVTCLYFLLMACLSSLLGILLTKCISCIYFHIHVSGPPARVTVVCLLCVSVTILVPAYDVCDKLNLPAQGSAQDGLSGGCI